MTSASATPNPAASFEPFRRRLLGLAYRMVGSMADAEDAVQETYLRWHSVDRETVFDPRAFLMTTTTRICLDMLTSARARREEYVGPWLPEPVVDTAALAPDSRTELAEDLSIALLLTLDRLSPLERAAFLLHDVFDFSFSEVATALERSEAACRQLAARARAHVRTVRPRGVTAPRAGAAVLVSHGSNTGSAPCVNGDVTPVLSERGGTRKQPCRAWAHIDHLAQIARIVVPVTLEFARCFPQCPSEHVNSLPSTTVRRDSASECDIESQRMTLGAFGRPADAAAISVQAACGELSAG